MKELERYVKSIRDNITNVERILVKIESLMVAAEAEGIPIKDIPEVTGKGLLKSLGDDEVDIPDGYTPPVTVASSPALEPTLLEGLSPEMIDKIASEFEAILADGADLEEFKLGVMTVVGKVVGETSEIYTRLSLIKEYDTLIEEVKSILESARKSLTPKVDEDTRSVFMLHAINEEVITDGVVVRFTLSTSGEEDAPLDDTYDDLISMLAHPKIGITRDLANPLVFKSNPDILKFTSREQLFKLLTAIFTKCKIKINFMYDWRLETEE